MIEREEGRARRGARLPRNTRRIPRGTYPSCEKGRDAQTLIHRGTERKVKAVKKGGTRRLNTQREKLGFEKGDPQMEKNHEGTLRGLGGENYPFYNWSKRQGGEGSTVFLTEGKRARKGGLGRPKEKERSTGQVEGKLPLSNDGGKKTTWREGGTAVGGQGGFEPALGDGRNGGEKKRKRTILTIGREEMIFGLHHGGRPGKRREGEGFQLGRRRKKRDAADCQVRRGISRLPQSARAGEKKQSCESLEGRGGILTRGKDPYPRANSAKDEANF